MVRDSCSTGLPDMDCNTNRTDLPDARRTPDTSGRLDAGCATRTHGYRIYVDDRLAGIAHRRTAARIALRRSARAVYSDESYRKLSDT